MTFSCELDPKLTEADFPFFVPDIQGNWGQACGRNRGVFVLDPPDGHTYGEGQDQYRFSVDDSDMNEVLFSTKMTTGQAELVRRTVSVYFAR